MTRASVATDNFNSGYTDGAFPTSNWTDLNGNNGQFKVETSSGTVYVPYGNVTTMRRSSLGSYTADQYAKAKITGLTGSASNDRAGVVCRASSDTTPNNDSYALYLDDGSTKTATLVRIVNNTATSLATDTSATWVAGDTISLEVTGTGATVTLNGYRNDVLLPSITAIADSNAARLTAIGGPGLYGLASGSTLRLDDFDAGNVTAGTAIAPIAQSHYRRRRSSV